MQSIARDERDTRAVWRHPDTRWAPGTVLSCGPRDAVVFASNGRIAGTLGPGRYALDPAQMPFLTLLGAPGGSLQGEAIFVDVAPLSVQFGGRSTLSGPTGPMGVNASGTVRLRIADPPRLVQAAAGDVERAAAMLDGSVVMAELPGVLAHASAGAVDPSALGDPSRLAAVADELAAAVAVRVGPFGIEVLRCEGLTLALDAAAATPSASNASAPSDPVYEMLWDCRHCGAAKLLGLTHKHCPNCGAPQNAAERYYPSEADKVAVQNHRYFGADRVCRYCGNANGRQSKHCGTCGGPLEEGADIGRRADQVDAPVVAQPRSSSSKKSVLGWVLGLSALGLVALVVTCVFWKKSATLVVAGHGWKREIQIERFGTVADSEWCNRLPAGANVLARTKEIRSHEKVKSGENCTKRKVDQGDGTYREKRECTPTYDDKPIYDDKCRYTVRKWHPDHTLTATGTSLGDVPHWPSVSGLRSGECEGCEREGRRSESYSVSFVDPTNRASSSCTVDQPRWQSIADGSRWRASVRVIGGSLDCGSLAPY